MQRAFAKIYELRREAGAFLKERPGEICGDWMRNVRADPDLAASKQLKKDELADHIPQILNDLCEFLNGAEAQGNKGGSELHGLIRWEQGYTLQEFLREIGILRIQLARQLSTFWDIQRGCTSDVRKLLLHDIYTFFDRIATRSTEKFVKHQEEQLRLRLIQLNEANARLSPSKTPA